MAMSSCDPCKARSRSMVASFWCPFCREAFCKVCCQFHQTMKLTRTHKVRALADVTPGEREQGHMTSPYSFDKTLTSLTLNEKTQLREVDNILLVMDSLSDTALTLKKMFFDLKMQNESEKNECMRKVVLFRDKLKRLADDFERHITLRLDDMQRDENHHIDDKIEECENIFNHVEMSKDMTHVIKTERITPQTIIKVNAARQRCDEYKYSLQRVHSRLQPVKFNLAIAKTVSDALTTSPAVIGEVEVSHENDEVMDEIERRQAARIGRRDSTLTNPSRLASVSRPHTINMNAELTRRSHEIYLNRKDDHDEPMIAEICMLSNNHFLTLDRNNNKLLLVHQDGVIVTQYVFTSQIWDMALVDSLTAAITVPDNDKVVMVKVRNNNLCAERLIKTSNLCYGICAIDGFLVVTVKGGYVKILTKAGEEVASIRHNHRGDVMFTDPQHVATNREQNELYVTDYTLHTLTALCLTGVKFEPQPKFVFRNNELRNPTGLCVDMNGNVYVCGYSSHNVIKISPGGELVHVLVSGVINPQAATLSLMEDQIYVSALTSGRSKHMQNVVQVYRI